VCSERPDAAKKICATFQRIIAATFFAVCLCGYVQLCARGAVSAAGPPSSPVPPQKAFFVMCTSCPQL